MDSNKDMSCLIDKMSVDLIQGDLMSRLAAAHELRVLGSAARPALPQLQMALDDLFPQVCVASAHAIGSIGVGAITVFPKLIEISKEESIRGELVRSGMFTILKGLLPPPADLIPQTVALLLASLKSRYDNSRLFASYGLYLLGNNSLPAIEELFICTSDHDIQVRFWASSAIREIGVAVKPFLNDLLFSVLSNDENVLYNIFESLKSLGNDARPAFDFLSNNYSRYNATSKVFVDEFLQEFRSLYLDS